MKGGAIGIPLIFKICGHVIFFEKKKNNNNSIATLHFEQIFKNVIS